ncbi:hypothetical protein ACFFIX_16560 [Metabacillus herbersteinensis]|uniref:Uncharacterized protein n=1 Tax=Metabacillus herbersteinensis TaxID=283816 RepID=A0ABV6GIU2_9BACI
MSDYHLYLAERDKIDFLLQKGYRINGVLENLSGAFVQFEKEIDEETTTETLHILTAEARKYFSVMMIKQK